MLSQVALNGPPAWASTGDTCPNTAAPDSTHTASVLKRLFEAGDDVRSTPAGWPSVLVRVVKALGVCSFTTDDPGVPMTPSCGVRLTCDLEGSFPHAGNAPQRRKLPHQRWL